MLIVKETKIIKTEVYPEMKYDNLLQGCFSFVYDRLVEGKY